eukprot:jgi/Botrbrau1/15499/Bobra.43_2s0116.1
MAAEHGPCPGAQGIRVGPIYMSLDCSGPNISPRQLKPANSPPVSLIFFQSRQVGRLRFLVARLLLSMESRYGLCECYSGFRCPLYRRAHCILRILTQIRLGRALTIPGVIRKRKGARQTHPNLRTDLDCPHFDYCSGCSLQNIDVGPQILARARDFFSNHGVPDLATDVGQVHAWRLRARVAVRHHPDMGLCMGLFEAGTHRVQPIPQCRIQHPRINGAAELARLAAVEVGITPYDEASGTGDLRYIQLTGAGDQSSSFPSAQMDAKASVQVVLVWNSSMDDTNALVRLTEFASELWRRGGPGSCRKLRKSQLEKNKNKRDASQSESHPLLLSVTANFQTSRGNAILGSQWKHLFGPQAMWQAFGQALVCLSPGAFVQSNFGAMESCLADIVQLVPANASIADLHAGVGTIGASSAPKSILAL